MELAAPLRRQRAPQVALGRTCSRKDRLQMATKSPRNDNAGRKRKITKFALAGVAVLGVGAALTSAAWTDNVLFGGTATSGSIDLVGRVAGVPRRGSTRAAITIAPARRSPIWPRSNRRPSTLEVRNSGRRHAGSPDCGRTAIGWARSSPARPTDDIAITLRSATAMRRSRPASPQRSIVTLTPPTGATRARTSTRQLVHGERPGHDLIH